MRRIAFAIVVCLTPVLLAQTGVGYHITRTLISAATAAGTTSSRCRPSIASISDAPTA